MLPQAARPTYMEKKPVFCALDLEGILVPEIWIAVSAETGIEKLRLTTRDIPDYDKLMRGRLKILETNDLNLKDIQDVIQKVNPFPGSLEFLDWLRSTLQVVVLSDTFYEFARPLMKKLNNPTLFCNSLITDKNNMIIDYHLRVRDGKRRAVSAFKELGFFVISIGDSYNDTSMLGEADLGILFRPPENIINEFPEFKVLEEYAELKSYISGYLPDSTEKQKN